MNNKEITDLISLDEIFNERIFVIPDYQRGYSWESQQLLDLKKDILKLNNIDHKHYTGTIVITKNHSDNCYDIVDGQQRLTSLIILLSQIYWTDPVKYSFIKDKYFIKGGIGNETQIFSLGSEDNPFFKELLFHNKEGSPENLSQTRILDSKRFCNDQWVSDKSLNLEDLYSALSQKLGFILFQPSKTKEIGIMFEVINNRGKSLSQLEKIKNYFIYLSTIHQRETLREEINQKWGKILFNLNKANVKTLDEENSFLRNSYLVFYDPNKTKSWNVYDELKSKYEGFETKEQIDAVISEIKKFVDFLLSTSLYYAYLLNEDKYFESHFVSRDKIELGEILTKLRCQPNNASILPLYLAVMSNIEIPDRIPKIIYSLKLIEKLNFRLYILPKVAGRADSKQSELFQTAFDFFHNPNWNSINDDKKFYTPFSEKIIEGDIFDWLNITIEDFVYKFCPEYKFVQALTLDEDEYDDFYNWVGLRYFLASYEKYLQRDVHNWDLQNILKTRKGVGNFQNDFLSKEHIWAKKNRVNEFPIDHIEKRRLGNFVLVGLSKNIQLSDNDISLKIEELNENSTGELRLFQIEQLRKVYSDAETFIKVEKGRIKKTKAYYENLAKKCNDIRENELIKFALENWKLPDESFNKFIKVDSFEYRPNTKEKFVFEVKE